MNYASRRQFLPVESSIEEKLLWLQVYATQRKAGRDLGSMEMLLTVEQAAQRLNLHPVTVREHLSRGQLRGVKRGRVWRIPESALTEAASVESRKPDPATKSPLALALALVRQRDAAGTVAVRTDGDAASDVRANREAHTP